MDEMQTIFLLYRGSNEKDSSLTPQESTVLIIVMALSLLTSVFLITMSLIQFYKYVLKVPKLSRTLSVTVFYVIALITLLTILTYAACSYNSESNLITFTIFMQMQSLAEVGIQIIAVS